MIILLHRCPRSMTKFVNHCPMIELVFADPLVLFLTSPKESWMSEKQQYSFATVKLDKVSICMGIRQTATILILEKQANKPHFGLKNAARWIKECRNAFRWPDWRKAQGRLLSKTQRTCKIGHFITAPPAIEVCLHLVYKIALTYLKSLAISQNIS